MSGIIVIDKPKGASSFSVVEKIRKIINVKKAGHTGTLDPLATGVLPICVGEATKISDFIMEGDKAYEVIAKLGERTNTLDADGSVVATGTKAWDKIDQKKILEVLKNFEGEILQTPPMFSAIKKDGVPLYKLARKGEEIEREQRKITIHEIKILKVNVPYISLMVKCSKGTYIRTLIDDMGERLGTYAHVTELRRIKNGLFDISEAMCLDNKTTENDIQKRMISIEDVVKRIMPIIEVDNDVAKKIANGYVMDLGVNDARGITSRNKNGDQKMVSINKASKTLRVFNYEDWK